MYNCAMLTCIYNHTSIRYYHRLLKLFTLSPKVFEVFPLKQLTNSTTDGSSSITQFVDSLHATRTFPPTSSGRWKTKNDQKQ